MQTGAYTFAVYMLVESMIPLALTNGIGKQSNNIFRVSVDCNCKICPGIHTECVNENSRSGRFYVACS